MTEMIAVKTKDLDFNQLCYAVALLEMPDLVWGDTIGMHAHSNQVVVPNLPAPDCYSPYTSWEMCGPIIEREKISLIRCDDEYETDSRGFTNNKRIPVWAAEHGGGHGADSRYGPQGDNWGESYAIDRDDCHYGSTPLIAAMRCYVANKRGKEVKIPAELVQDQILPIDQATTADKTRKHKP